MSSYTESVRVRACIPPQSPCEEARSESPRAVGSGSLHSRFLPRRQAVVEDGLERKQAANEVLVVALAFEQQVRPFVTACLMIEDMVVSPRRQRNQSAHAADPERFRPA